MNGFFLNLSVLIINLALWIFFVVRFKHLFSTDEIIETAKSEIEKIVTDMNRNTARNVEIIDEKIENLKEVAAEATRKIVLAKNESEKQKRVTEFSEKIYSAGISPGISSKPLKKTAQKKSAVQNISASENSRTKNSSATSAKRKMRSTQKSSNPEKKSEELELFSEINFPQNLENEKINAQQNSKNYDENFAPNSTDMPSIVVAENLIQNSQEQSITEKIRLLYAKGYKNEEIASMLGCSIFEVQLAISV